MPDAEAALAREITLREALSRQLAETREERDRIEGKLNMMISRIEERYPDLDWTAYDDPVAALLAQLEDAE